MSPRGSDSGAAPILVINSGSSSLKFSIFSHTSGDEQLLLSGVASNIAKSGGRLKVEDSTGTTLVDEQKSFRSQKEALGAVSVELERLKASGGVHPEAIGHRVVHGGPRLREHQRITPEVLRILEESRHFAPLHIPPSLELIRETEKRFPGVPEIACFDTAFHRTLPEAASRFPLPAELWRDGILRYGFHGLSYESIVSILGQDLRPRTVVAHLGNGSSLAALENGVSVDTSMGLTPTGGIPMSSRSGDLDPGILLYLMRARGMDADGLEKLLNRNSGLAAFSGGESDVRSLQQASGAGDKNAALAIEVFCRSIAKTIAAYATVLGGLDLVVFTAGIGENSAPVRAMTVASLGFLGIELDEEANRANQTVISTSDSACELRVLHTDEDRQIARHTRRLLAPSSSPGAETRLA